MSGSIGTPAMAERMGPAELRSLREFVGYSIEDLTRHLSVSRSIVQKWEAGNSPVPPGVAAAMEALQHAYQDAVAIALADGSHTVSVPRTDAESWDSTGRPARWHRQIAAAAHLERGARIVYTSPT